MPYGDIIHLPHPTSAKHPRMPIRDRAAIFSPFAALSDHSAAIAETARLTDQRLELDEDARAELDRRQQIGLKCPSPGSGQTSGKRAGPMSPPPAG